jgi:hypothetical protein
VIAFRISLFDFPDCIFGFRQEANVACLAVAIVTKVIAIVGLLGYFSAKEV